MKMIRLFALMLFASVSYAENNGENYLHHFLKNTQKLEAKFKQTLLDAKGIELESSTGVVFLNRPDKFRWDYQYPYTQTIVTNGELLWFYDKDIEQVIIQDVSSSVKNTPAVIFRNYKDIDEQFIIIDLGNIEQFNWMELIPRDIDSQYNSIRLGFDKGSLGMIVIFDLFDQVTRINFTDEIINKKIDDSIFNFELPQNVDIIDNRS